MKTRNLCVLCVLWLAMSVAQAQEFAYLTFRTTDGTEQSISTKGLKITFPNGQMKAVAGAEEVVRDLADLQSMFFTAQPTAIEAIDFQNSMPSIVNGTLRLPFGNEERATVYTLDGRMVGSQRLTPGIYLVRWNGRTHKIMAR